MAKKKLLKKTVDRPLSERHFGVILEDIDSKLNLVVEGQGALDVKIDKVDEKLEDFKKEVNYKFDIVFEKFDEVDQKFDEVDQRFDEVDQRFDEVDQRFNEVTDELHVIRNELKEKVGRDEFVLLEKRVAALEKTR
ncbi:V-type ATPase 116kDa subunit family protein [Candidatus Wolfebacteria bacterium]|nr:V-type ATPase 116kDa subunit family protein [Candidatus Wolfebacteria bacterium]